MQRSTYYPVRKIQEIQGNVELSIHSMWSAVMVTCLRAAAKASIAAASFPGVLAASWETALAINISEAPGNTKRRNETLDSR